MLKLNFSNVEDLIFYNTEIQNKLPTRLYSIFEQWRLSKQVSFLKGIGKQSVLDFLNQITDQDIAVLEEHFGERVVIEKLNYSIVQNLKIPLKEIHDCNEIHKIDPLNYFSTWRDDEYLYITFWR